MTQPAPAFERSMKTFGALLITLSSLTPASSLFIVVPGIVQQAGTGALLAFATASVLSLFIGLVYAELASAFPFTGGEYTIVGRVVGPFLGFIVLGVNLFVLVLNISVIALGLGPYLEPLIGHTSAVGAAVVSVIFTTLCGILNIRTNALITGVFLGLEVLALVILGILGLTHPVRPLLPMLTHPVFLNGTGLAPAGLMALGLAGSASIFATYGFGNAIFLGEETHDAPRHIARAVLLALVIGVVTQFAPLAAVLTSAPDLAAMFGSTSMFGDFVAQRGGRIISVIISLSIAASIINCNIAFVILVARLLFSTGRDKVWPATVNRALMLIHPRFGSPWVATLCCGVLTAGLCWVPLNVLLVMTGTAIVVVYAALCIAVLVGRGNGTTGHAAFRMKLHPAPAILGLVGIAAVIFANALDPAVGQPSLMATAVIMALSAAYYWLVLRRRGVWVLHAPADTGAE